MTNHDESQAQIMERDTQDFNTVEKQKAPLAPRSKNVQTMQRGWLFGWHFWVGTWRDRECMSKMGHDGTFLTFHFSPFFTIFHHFSPFSPVCLDGNGN
jgi:hypothetical protein